MESDENTTVMWLFVFSVVGFLIILPHVVKKIYTVRNDTHKNDFKFGDK